MNNHLSFLPVTWPNQRKITSATFRIGPVSFGDSSWLPAEAEVRVAHARTARPSRSLPAATRGSSGSPTHRIRTVLRSETSLQLVGYDSRDGKGERIICGERANYYRPLITPDGERIVFSNRQTWKIYVVKWDGSRPRLLKEPGCATEVWRDPRDGKDMGLLPGKSRGLHEAGPSFSD